MLETLDYSIRIGSKPDLFIFRFVSLLCLRSTLRLKSYCSDDPTFQQFNLVSSSGILEIELTYSLSWTCIASSDVPSLPTIFCITFTIKQQVKNTIIIVINVTVD